MTAATFPFQTFNINPKNYRITEAKSPALVDVNDIADLVKLKVNILTLFLITILRFLLKVNIKFDWLIILLSLPWFFDCYHIQARYHLGQLVLKFIMEIIFGSMR